LGTFSLSSIQRWVGLESRLKDVCELLKEVGRGVRIEVWYRDLVRVMVGAEFNLNLESFGWLKG